MTNKYDFKVDQVWKNTETGDRFVILSVGPDYIGWRYDTSRFGALSARNTFAQGSYELVKPKIKKTLSIFRGTGPNADIYVFQDGNTTDECYWKWVAKIEVEFEEGQGLDPCMCEKKCQCNRC